MDCLCKVWIHSLCRAIHGLSPSHSLRITYKTCGCSVLGGEYERVITTTRFKGEYLWAANYLKISSVWKSLVASCVWGVKFECTFSTCSLPTLKSLLLAQNMFIPCTKDVRVQHNGRVHLLFVRWFRKHGKRTQTRGQCFCKTSFQLRIAEPAEAMGDWLGQLSNYTLLYVPHPHWIMNTGTFVRRN